MRSKNRAGQKVNRCENILYINPDQVAQDRFGDWNSPKAVMQAAQYCEEKREACLRMIDGQLFKQYTDDIPEWATTILKLK